MFLLEIFDLKNICTTVYITIYESRRNDELCDGVELESAYIKRRHEKTRLSGDFHDIFSKVSTHYKLADKIALNVPKLEQRLITNAEITELDRIQNLRGGQLVRESDMMHLQTRFDVFVRDMTSPFAPARSTEIMKRSIYQFFDRNTEIDDLMERQNVVLFENNKELFTAVLTDAKEQFTRDIVDKINREMEITPEWNIPESMEHTKIYKETNYKKCSMFPAYVKDDIRNEIRFMEYLEEMSGVKWWFKNEYGDKKYFAIKYTDPETGEPRAFYVDFIIRMNDSRIGLFDTKAGFTAKSAGPKAEALSMYIKRNKSKKMSGGIAIFEDGVWLYNDSEKYKYDEQDLSGWEELKLSV